VLLQGRRRIAALLVASALIAAGCDAGEGSRVAGLWREASQRLGLAAPADGDDGGAPRAQPRAATDESEEDGALATLRRAFASAPAEPETGGGYWRYSESNGSVRFVQSLAEVPESARASAQRIEASLQRPAPSARPAARPARPARARAAPEPEPRRAEAATVVVYTTSWCGWCRKTLAWLDERGVDYENRDIERNPAWAAELQRKTGSQSIPVVDVDGRIVRGFDPGTLARLL
jgi:glutaredoxin